MCKAMEDRLNENSMQKAMQIALRMIIGENFHLMKLRNTAVLLLKRLKNLRKK